ncbi:MAG: hypothetical protein J6W47_06075, partial [Bacteroidales bacterium]|nr:hypothetical protein [Bacteroidales bacterium]
TKNVKSVSKTGLPAGLTGKFDAEAQTYTISGAPTTIKNYTSGKLTFVGKYNSVKLYATFKLNVVEATTGIAGIEEDPKPEADCYDLLGRRVTNPQHGQLYIIGGRKRLY